MIKKTKKVTDFIAGIAKSIGGKEINGVIHLPKDMGVGFIKAFIINPHLRLMVRHYELKEDWVLNRNIDEDENRIVMITFQNIIQSKVDVKKGLLKPTTIRKLLPSVQVATTGLNYELLQANKKMNSIIITVYIDYLKELLKPQKGNYLLKMIISGSQPFLFEEIISPRILDIAAEIVETNPPIELQNFYYKLKTEELIYLLFVELLKRETTPMQMINAADVKKVYLVKNEILADINTPPLLSELVKLSGLSESKLKRLFKQIFGNSIYNYYQIFRMKEAAYLLKEEKLSVSEVGYRLGFSNLSHFTRVFEKHNGMKPKKYSTIK